MMEEKHVMLCVDGSSTTVPDYGDHHISVTNLNTMVRMAKGLCLNGKEWNGCACGGWDCEKGRIRNGDNEPYGKARIAKEPRNLWWTHRRSSRSS